MAGKKVTATVTSPGTIISATVTDQNQLVHQLVGDGSSKSADLHAEEDGTLQWFLTVSAAPQTGWTFTLTPEGASSALVTRTGVIDDSALGTDAGAILVP
ncbi:MAG TPA: hypothetical protein VKU00_14640 [Chthonomonadaceae bacterium]|nr:hypothetical protein [Chthonomonadaceae bacterium]